MLLLPCGVHSRGGAGSTSASHSVIPRPRGLPPTDEGSVGWKGVGDEGHPPPQRGPKGCVLATAAMRTCVPGARVRSAYSYFPIVCHALGGVILERMTSSRKPPWAFHTHREIKTDSQNPQCPISGTTMGAAHRWQQAAQPTRQAANDAGPYLPPRVRTSDAPSPQALTPPARRPCGMGMFNDFGGDGNQGPHAPEVGGLLFAGGGGGGVDTALWLDPPPPGLY